MGQHHEKGWLCSALGFPHKRGVQDLPGDIAQRDSAADRPAPTVHRPVPEREPHDTPKHTRKGHQPAVFIRTRGGSKDLILPVFTEFSSGFLQKHTRVR